MRRALSLLGVVSAIPVVLAVPVVTPPAVAPTPVAPHLAQLAVAPLPATTGVVADTGKKATRPFTMAGATFEQGSLPLGARVELRTRTHGAWSSWTPLPMPDEAPDDGSVDARAAAVTHRAATDPLYVGEADGVQARVVDASGGTGVAPRDLDVVLVDGGTSAADASPGPAHPLGGVVSAAQAQPTIYTRSQWGADESLRTRNSGCGSPSYGSTIKMGFVHHTDGANGYTASQVPSILRSIYAYHVESNGWCDIGYNFLVDRFGRVWEGRYGGIDKPVIGAHTGGFNTDTFGTSLIGNFSSTRPPAAMQTALEQLFAWKLGRYYLDPHGKARIVAGSFSGSRYSTGSTVTFNVISGHRDADTTTCPGTAAYSLLPTFRDAVAGLVGAGFVAPSIAPTSVRMLSGTPVTVKASVLDAVTWTLTVAGPDGTTVRSLNGTADTSTPLAVSWDGLNGEAAPAPPGTYTLTLTAADASGATAVPYSRQVTVTPPVTVTVPPTATYGATVPVTGTAAPNTAVTVTLQRGSETAESRSVTAAADGTWSTSLHLDGDYTVTASVPQWTTPAATVKAAPEVTSPALPASRTLFVRAGSAVAFGGTALPGSTVQLVTTLQGPSGSAGTTSVGPALTAGGDGSWSGGSVKPASASVVVAQRESGVASAPVTLYPVGAPTTSAPTTGYSNRLFRVRGNAGNAPVTVQLFLTTPDGSGSGDPVATTTAAVNGSFVLRATLPTVTSATDVTWRIATSAGDTVFDSATGSVSVQPEFAPTATAPVAGYYRATVPVSGQAVPGDVVTLWRRAVGTKTWIQAATARAAASGAFTAAFILYRDTAWRITSRSGSTAIARVVVRPSIRTPTSAARRAVITGWGYAVPGQKVAVYRRPIGTTPWRYFGTVTASWTGRWTDQWHLIYPMNVRVVSQQHLSPIRTIRVG